MRANRWTITSVALALLLVLSMYVSYRYMETPSTVTKNHLQLLYHQSAEYDVIAYVKPSLLYENRTKVTLENPFYLRLVEKLEVTLHYSLEQEPRKVSLDGVILRYEATETLNGVDWTKVQAKHPSRNMPATFSETFTINVVEIQEIIDAIRKETATGIPSYSYKFTPEITLEASARGTPVVQHFAPVLTVKFEGAKIHVEGLSSTKPGSVSSFETEVATINVLGASVEVAAVKASSVIMTLSLASIFAESFRRALKERSARSPLERLSGETRDKIIESSEPPMSKEGLFIKTRSFEDLVRAAEETFRPIIRYGNTFYVLDGDVRYAYTHLYDDSEVSETPQVDEESSDNR